MILLSILTITFLAYSFSLYVMQPVKVTTETVASAKGKILWQKHNCNACHQVYGLGGFLGPDLTNEFTLKGADPIKAFLRSGTDIMPDFKLSDDEIQNLLAYLKEIDASGKADPRTFTIRLNGTIDQ